MILDGREASGVRRIPPLWLEAKKTAFFTPICCCWPCHTAVNLQHMSALEAAEQLLAKMNRAEKAQVLQWAARDIGEAFPGIESRPDVCGGEPCLVRTRIPVWLLEQARRLGTSEAVLLGNYPTLRAEDLANAWGYVRSHRQEIDRQIELNEAD